MKKFTLAELQMLVLNDTVITTSGGSGAGGTESENDGSESGNTNVPFNG